MFKNSKARLVAILMAVGLLGWLSGPAVAAVRIEGQVQAGGGPVAHSVVTLWAAGANAPTQLAQAETGADGRFVISVDQSPGGDTSLYLVASGGEPAKGNPPGITRRSPCWQCWVTSRPRRSPSTR
jgi:hypothetical protein